MKWMHRRPAALTALLAVAAMGLAACGSSGGASGDGAAPTGTASPAALTQVRIGFFPNVTHAPAFVALQEGFYNAAFKDLKIKVTPTLFNAGPDAVNAVFGDAIDISYIGPNPTVSAWTQSKGEAVRVISGAASGGASLVVKPDLTSAAALKGKKLATPQLGNTQDVALRYWLKQQGLATDAQTGSGDVNIQPMSNSDAVTAFQSGAIDGAWLPEPYASQLVAVGGKTLVDERTLWPNGQFVVTNVVARSAFLDEHPEVVEAFLQANTEAIEFIKKNPAKAQADFNSGLKALTGSSIDPALLASAWKNLEFTVDPLKATLVASAAHAVEVGLLDQAKVDGAGGFDPLYDLDPLNKVLAAQKLDQITS